MARFTGSTYSRRTDRVEARYLLFLIAGLVILLSPCRAIAQSSTLLFVAEAKNDVPTLPTKTELEPVSLAATHVIAAPTQEPPKGVAWGPLVRDSVRFVAVEHAFRFLTEKGTRNQLVNEPFFGGYFDAVESLHGWSDGDPFYVNYVGHSMQGAVSSYIWQHNDRAYRSVEFGRNRRYWKSKLRGLAFAYVYSVQFEIGPFSEASIGHIQHEYPQVGFVDHVMTPTIGTGWAIAEDYLDRELIQRSETKIRNKWFRLLLRSGLNPSRSFANMMSGNVPWHRDDRPGVSGSHESLALRPAGESGTSREISTSARGEHTKGLAPFEFALTATHRTFLASPVETGCWGGSGEAALRLSSHWQILGEAGGCKVSGLEYPHSGDVLDYSIGSRWTASLGSKWQPHVQFAIGGIHITQELVDEAKKEKLTAIYKPQKTAPPHDLYSTNWEENSSAIKVGAGVGYNINSALSLKLIDVNYGRNWLNPVNGIDYRNSLQWTSGMVLRIGTW